MLFDIEKDFDQDLIDRQFELSEEMAKQDCPNESRGKMERHRLGSIEAQEFIAENPASAVLPPDGSRIEQFRRDSAEYFQPRVDRALSRYDISVENTIISGIPCLEVTPNAGKVRGVVLHFFGGGFVCGSAYESLLLAAPICQYSTVKIVLPEYRLSPENLWPDAIEDCFAVYKELEKRLSGISLAISGDSAGGNLALAIALRAHHENVPLPAALALLSPWCDLTNQGDTLKANDGRDPTLTRAWLNEAAKLYASAADLSQPTLSPIFASYPSEFPPVMITTGTRDLLMSQSISLNTRLRDAANECTIRIWDHLWHVFEYYDELPESKTSLEEIAQFLAARLNSDNNAVNCDKGL